MRGLVVVMLGTAAVPAVAAVDIVKSRIAAYRELGAAFKGINDSLRAGEVQPVILNQYAREIRNVAKGQYGWFPKGSGPKPGVKTGALPAIWAKPAEFKAAQDGLAKASAGFDAAVKTGKADAIKTAARNLGMACKGCHEKFRAKTD